MSITEDNPYVRLWDPETGQTVYEHRVLAEKNLGRPLEPGEVVHHEHGRKWDNSDRRELRVFRNQSQHMIYHHYRRREERGIIHLFPVEDFLEGVPG